MNYLLVMVNHVRNSVEFYAFITGLYFSILQFSYFLILQFYVSSTYVTYMMVVLSWIIGTLIGLWWVRLSVLAIFVAGIAGFYLTNAMLIIVPMSSWTLFVASICIMITGVWSGRFFIQVFSWSKRIDSLFFNENNGFMLGIVFVFTGFTLLGRAFILIAPLVCAGLLLKGTLKIR